MAKKTWETLAFHLNELSVLIFPVTRPQSIWCNDFDYYIHSLDPLAKTTGDALAFHLLDFLDLWNYRQETVLLI